MAFFFTMPISRMMPISAMMLSSVRKISSASSAPDARRGKRGENRDRMDVILVENSQHDVDRDQRRQNQIGLGGQGVLKDLRRALKAGWMVAGRTMVRTAFCTATTACPSVTFGARLNERVMAGNCP